MAGAYQLLQDESGQVFLIDCQVQSGSLHVALLVVDGIADTGWLRVSDPRTPGDAFLVQLPQEVVAQSARYKGYDCTVPCRKLL